MEDFYIERIEKLDTLPEVSKEVLILVKEIKELVKSQGTFFTEIEKADLKFFSEEQLKGILSYLNSQLKNTVASGKRSKREKIEFVLKIYQRPREVSKYRFLTK